MRTVLNVSWKEFQEMVMKSAAVIQKKERSDIEEVRAKRVGRRTVSCATRDASEDEQMAYSAQGV